MAAAVEGADRQEALPRPLRAPALGQRARVVDRLCEQAEDRAVVIFVGAHLRVVARGLRRAALAKERRDAVPAHRGGRLRRDAEAAVGTEREVPQRARDRARDAPAEPAPEGEDVGPEPRERRVAPARVVQHRARPARDRAHGLHDVRAEAREALASSEEHAAHERRVHLLFLPDPAHRVADRVARIRGQRERLEPRAEHGVAVGDGDELLALEAEERDGADLRDRIARMRGLERGQVLARLLDDRITELRDRAPHRERHAPPASAAASRVSNHVSSAVSTRGELRVEEMAGR